MNILVTGCAGFIGFHFCNNLLKKFNKIKIFGVDNFNNYYDTNLKKNREITEAGVIDDGTAQKQALKQTIEASTAKKTKTK